MRWCTSPPLLLTATATATTAAAAAAAAATTVVLAASPATSATPATPATPSCAAADARTFPLAARIRGGPASYEAGGRPRTWYIDLTNTTDRTCAGVHPVVVLVGEKRALRPDRLHLDFYDGPRVRPVTFEATGARELVGVLDGTGFAGFTVPPGRTVGVRVRLSLGPGAVTDRVTVNAAVVQRRGEDGDWVGESGAYRFSVTEDDGEAAGRHRPWKEQDAGPVREAQAAHPPGTPTPAPRAGQPAAAGPESARTPLTTALAPVLALLTLLAAATGTFLLLRRRR
ncbi:hypothetical protein AB0E62_05525 [Streptomyces sp. NPDC038707]|uniref:hypothetical protein n=1 Tax=Streptomyces sp. NPDC038707 TaxID=3154329 RepID=UPI0033F18F03